jgi:hypothetical protein
MRPEQKIKILIRNDRPEDLRPRHPRIELGGRHFRATLQHLNWHAAFRLAGLAQFAALGDAGRVGVWMGAAAY